MKFLIVSIFCALSSFTVFAQSDVAQQVKDYINSGEFDKAGELIQNDNSLDKPLKLSLSGELNLRLLKLEEAEEELSQALDLINEDDDPALYSETLNRLALVFLNQGQYVEAEKYMLRANDIRNKYFADDASLLAASYNDLGLISTNIDTDAALDYYEKALELYKESFGTDSEKVAQALINTGYLYRELELYGDATNNFTEAKRILEKIYPDGHPTLGFIEVNLGRTYYQMGLKPSAETSYENAVAAYKNSYGERHPELATVYNLIGQTKADNGDFETALQYYQQALIANTKKFSNTDVLAYPSLSDYYQPNTYLLSLLYKSRAFQQKHFEKTLKLRDLLEALNAIQKADSLLIKFQSTINNEQDKLALSQIGAEIYEEAVQLSYTIADNAFFKKDYFELAYYFNTRSKATVLQESIAASRAKNFAGLPQPILEKENKLLSEINYLRQQLKDKPNADEEVELRSKLIVQEREYGDLISDLEQNYPKYYKLKYEKADLSVTEMAAKLKEGTAMISYFLAESKNRLYIFTITSKGLDVEQRFLTDDFNRYVSGLRNGIFFRDKNSYLLSASMLYEYLVPRLSNSIKKLIVIPSGAISSVPFEALISEADESSFQNMPYLVRDYEISYAYAETLYFDQIAYEDAKPNALNLFMAPVQFDDFGLPSLPGTAEECKSISSMLRDNNISESLFLESKASERELKSQSNSNFNIVHLATHGLIDEREPDKSSIFLAAGGDDGRLYASEIYSLNFNANLLTLSACETGLGKITKGEGVMGFTRALLFAGAENIIVSLWSVQDNSTSQLMVDFYKNSLSEASYSKNLQRAKLNMINNSDFAEPFYWAPFILIGK